MRGKYKQGLYLGLDTSAYTTSLAVVDQDEQLIYDSRVPLPVKEGSLGLRQSDALFAHLLNLPQFWQGREKRFRGSALIAVAASTRPRPVLDSYMPVFKVSEALGLFLAQTMDLIFFASSHQEGHIIAGLWSAGLPAGRYLVLHLSGGTTEIIDAEETAPGSLILNLLGGSGDLNAGQFVDRIGKAMGIDFPAGPGLEKLAADSHSNLIKLPVAVCKEKGEISFSGPASHAERRLNEGCRKEDLARAVEICIADTLIAAIDGLSLKPDHFQGVLAVGGVTANLFIRQRLIDKLGDWNVFFALPQHASDNAVGLAVQAARLVGNASER